MRCDYCYYLQKEDLFASEGHKPGQLTRMSDEVLEAFIQQYIASQLEGHPVVFTWHGGESLLCPISYYQRALDLQKRYSGGKQIENCLQTNGLLLTEAWCRFFRDNHFLIGISLDGTESHHDRYRRTLGGAPSFARVMRGIEMMQRFGVEFNILSTVNRYNADEPIEYYQFLKQIGTQFIQFTPIVERIAPKASAHRQVEAPSIHAEIGQRLLFSRPEVELAPYSILPEQWGHFTTGVFDQWIGSDVGEVFVQLFDATLSGWMGVPPGVCTMAAECGHAGVIEHTGDVYSCDHYVYPRYHLGNIKQEALVAMMTSPEQLRFGRAKREGLTQQCRSCLYQFACNGECPKNRFALSQTGEPGHNYLCAGYYHFFDHVAPYMDYMKACLMQGQPASLVMRAITEGQLPTPGI